MPLHHSGLVVAQSSGLTENTLRVMIHRLCVSNEEIYYMWMLAHFIGLLMSIFVCTYVGIYVAVCVLITLQGSVQYSQLAEEGLMSQSPSTGEAIKCSVESAGHSVCLLLLFTLSPNSLLPFAQTSLLLLSFVQPPPFGPSFTLPTD